MTPLKLLIVDDEPDFRDVLSRTLKNAGYEVLAAESGEDAFGFLLEQFEEGGDTGVSLVISDCDMPGWTGFDLLLAIRTSAFSRLPIMLISGAMKMEEILSLAQHGPNAILLKPFQREVLMEKIRTILNQSTPPVPPQPKTV